MQQHQATSIHDIFSFPGPVHETDITVPVLQTKKLNHREVDELAQDHTDYSGVSASSRTVPSSRSCPPPLHLSPDICGAATWKRDGADSLEPQGPELGRQTLAEGVKENFLPARAAQ